ncbi:MAG: SAF domain-containing protein [Anaerolineales bacterium]
MRRIMFCLMLGCFILLTAHLAGAQSATVTIYTVSEPIPRGTIFVPEMLYGAGAVVQAQTWDAALAPETAITDLDAIQGRVARVDLPTRTPLLAGNLADDLTGTAAVGSDAALLVPLGWRAVPIPRDDMRPAPENLLAGDCVRITGLLDYGGALADTPWPLAEAARVVEAAPDAPFIALATAPDTVLTLVWLLEIGGGVRLEPSAACPRAAPLG